jgi:hypothetical protein
MSDTITRFVALLNQIVIVGKKKKWAFSRKRDFSIKIYHTPFKRRIVAIRTTGLDIDSLDLTFKIGDNISKAREWCENNKYLIDVDINRLDYLN